MMRRFACVMVIVLSTAALAGQSRAARTLDIWLAELAARIPILHFIDHGPNVQPSQAVDDFLRDTYPKLHEKSTHNVASVGARLDIKSFEVRIVTSAGQVLKIAPVPLPAPGPNTPPPPAHDGPAHWIKVAAQEDGSFTVTNARNGFSKTYGVVPK